jgi:hypothetical protein
MIYNVSNNIIMVRTTGLSAGSGVKNNKVVVGVTYIFHSFWNTSRYMHVFIK